MTIRTLTISDGVSRGRSTYGYLIVRLRDSETGKLYRCNGGGYDMVGTVLGQWLEDNCQRELLALADRAFYVTGGGQPMRRTDDEAGALYGMTAHLGEGGAVVRVGLDGACGVESMRRIAEAAGVKLTSLPSRHGQTEGWIVGDV